MNNMNKLAKKLLEELCDLEGIKILTVRVGEVAEQFRIDNSEKINKKGRLLKMIGKGIENEGAVIVRQKISFSVAHSRKNIIREKLYGYQLGNQSLFGLTNRQLETLFPQEEIEDTNVQFSNLR